MEELQKLMMQYSDTLSEYMGAIVRALHESGTCEIPRMIEILKEGQEWRDEPNSTVLAFVEGLQRATDEQGKPRFQLITGGKPEPLDQQ